MDILSAVFSKFLDVILSVFPLSPFTELINGLKAFPYLGYINWFVPVGDLLAVASGWLVAIGLYYAWSIVARWLKLIS